MSVNLLAQFFYAFIVKNYLSKVGGTQLQNKSISGTQQEKGWEPLVYSLYLFNTISNNKSGKTVSKELNENSRVLN